MAFALNTNSTVKRSTLPAKTSGDTFTRRNHRELVLSLLLHRYLPAVCTIHAGAGKLLSEASEIERLVW